MSRSTISRTHSVLLAWLIIVLWIGISRQAGAQTGGSATSGYRPFPLEPVHIGNTPQFVFDLYIVDNYWALKGKSEAVRQVAHSPKKHTSNPLFTKGDPGSIFVVRDPESAGFRMWYQLNQRLPNAVAGDGKRDYHNHIAYAESVDGVHWDRPHLDIYPWIKVTPNNVVLARPEFKTEFGGASPCIISAPEQDMRGYRYLLLYDATGRIGPDVSGLRVVGSHDGIHWDLENDVAIAPHLHSDTHNSVVYDARRQEYVLYCRARHIYGGKGTIDSGASRRVARMSSPSLWTDWLKHAEPQNILLPDVKDAASNYNFFYGMPTHYHAGIYWGFLQCFRLNDFIYTELATSRDGFEFKRHPLRARLIEYGADGAWDDEMIFVSPTWVEVGDEWWIYYSGWDGPHGTRKRTGGVGLAMLRKEGFYSLRGPQGGGVVCTRKLLWPGGDLFVNADADNGELKIRVSDADRRPIEGFDYADCDSFTGDSVAHIVTWGGRKSLSALDGEVIRLEFFLRNADLYTFRARETQ